MSPERRHLGAGFVLDVAQKVSLRGTKCPSNRREGNYDQILRLTINVLPYTRFVTSRYGIFEAGLKCHLVKTK